MHTEGCWLSFIRLVAIEPGSFPLDVRAETKRSNTMRKNYDFSRARRGSVLKSTGKTRITIMLDDELIEHFRARGDKLGVGYQTLINQALHETIRQKALTVADLRRVLREELRLV